MFLLDTNICIYLINQSHASVVEKITTHEPFEIKVSSITVAELEYGASKSQSQGKSRLALLKFLSSFEIVPFGHRDAPFFGSLRSYLERKGTIIGPYDLQIAAQALSRDLTLVSNNTKEFSRVPKLRLENWVEMIR